MSEIQLNEDELSQFIPNEAGLIVQEENSNLIRKEHNRWKQAVQKIKQKKKVKQMSYWQKVSSCAAL